MRSASDSVHRLTMRLTNDVLELHDVVRFMTTKTNKTSFDSTADSSESLKIVARNFDEATQAIQVLQYVKALKFEGGLNVNLSTVEVSSDKIFYLEGQQHTLASLNL